MDIAIPQEIETGGAVDGGDIKLNSRYAAGYEFLVQNIIGMDGASIRNPTTNRPHKSGALIHTFKRGARIWTIEGIILADTNTLRSTAADHLRGNSDAIMDTDGTYKFTPFGKAQRFLTARLYEPIEIEHGPGGISGPKAFSITLIAGDWRAYDVVPTEIILADGVPQIVPNGGNTESWLTFVIVGTGAAGITSFTLDNEDTGLAIAWDGTALETNWLNTAPFPRSSQLDMLDETFYQADQHNLLGGINLANSDFFPITRGGDTLLFNADLAGATATVQARAAWV